MKPQVGALHSNGQRRDLNLNHQVVRLQDRGVHIDKKLIERDATLAPFVSNDDRSIVNEQHRAGVGVRIVESEIATEGTLVSHAHIGDLRFGVS